MRACERSSVCVCMRMCECAQARVKRACVCVCVRACVCVCIRVCMCMCVWVGAASLQNPITAADGTAHLAAMSHSAVLPKRINVLHYVWVSTTMDDCKVLSQMPVHGRQHPLMVQGQCCRECNSMHITDHSILVCRACCDPVDLVARTISCCNPTWADFRERISQHTTNTTLTRTPLLQNVNPPTRG
jgi:hypothetical protein